MTKKTILFVDDETRVLKGIRRSLYPLQQDWDMVFVDSGPAALEAMRQKPPTVIVADMRMPGMNGYELLKTVQQQYPEVVRVMLTGQPDKGMYQEVMSVSHYFLWKPTSFEVFDRLFKHIQELNVIMQNEPLQKLIGSLAAIPSPPEIYFELTDLLEKEYTDSARIAEVINKDMSMAMQVLKLVNSAMFGFEREIDTLEVAITYLGIDTIRILVLAQHLFPKAERERRQALALDSLWDHSLHTARLAYEISQKNTTSQNVNNYAYLAGLLHDIGKLLLATQLSDVYATILQETQESGKPQHEVERERLGVDHSAIGTYLACLWGLPRTIVDAMAFHHAPDPLSTIITSPVTEAVWHANRISHGNYAQSENYLEFQ
jgi:HD-like signal output (HDOD) protein